MNDPPKLSVPAPSRGPSFPLRETPARRLAEHTADYLSDTELLSLLLKGSVSDTRSLEAARHLLAMHGSLTALAELTLEELQSVSGIGPAGASAVQSALALAARLTREKHPEGAPLESPASVASLMRGRFRTAGRETLYALMLNTRHRLIRQEMITTGLVDRSQAHAREVFRTAIRVNSSRIVLVHNHPGGDPTPSAQDIACTKNLVSAGGIIGIGVLDHMIIGRPDALEAVFGEIEEGGFHHPGCDQEKCPACGGRIISCGCPEGGG